ncbi:MAG: hypothetical protein JOZ39_02790 [Chloroflexi bacterium]|nr:hypothetical protein [Chloroflexota bacterium]
MKSTILGGTLAAISLSGVLALPALADSSSPLPSSVASPSTAGKAHKEKGCPDAFDAADAAGVRVCHSKEGFRLETTDPAKSGAHEYTGTLTTDGKFGSVQLIRAEQDDSASIDGNGNLIFDFKTFSGIDGVRFDVDGGKDITFNLMVDGQQIPAEHIWIGDKGRHPKADPFKLPTEHKDKSTQPLPSASPASSTA